MKKFLYASLLFLAVAIKMSGQVFIEPGNVSIDFNHDYTKAVLYCKNTLNSLTAGYYTTDYIKRNRKTQLFFHLNEQGLLQDTLTSYFENKLTSETILDAGKIKSYKKYNSNEKLTQFIVNSGSSRINVMFTELGDIYLEQRYRNDSLIRSYHASSYNGDSITGVFIEDFDKGTSIQKLNGIITEETFTKGLGKNTLKKTIIYNSNNGKKLYEKYEMFDKSIITINPDKSYEIEATERDGRKYVKKYDKNGKLLEKQQLLYPAIQNGTDY